MVNTIRSEFVAYSRFSEQYRTRMLADKFEVSTETIEKIIAKKTWKHLIINTQVQYDLFEKHFEYPCPAKRSRRK